MTKQSTTMDRQQLVNSLKGQKMHVPDIEAIFSDWPHAFNPDLEKLRLDIDERLQSFVDARYTHKSERALALKKLQAPNYALLGAYWWPFVDDRTLHTMTYAAIWVALWDDVFEVEAGTFEAGTLAKDWERAQNYRYQTMLYIRHALNLPCEAYQQRPDNIFITSFEDIAAHVNAVCNVEQKERLYGQFEEHIRATSEKHYLKLTPEVPTTGQYLDARMGTSGVRLCANLLEILHETGLTPEHRTDPDVKKLIDQVNIMILVTNDLFSLKLKLSRGNVDNLVALLWLSHVDMDSAVAIATSVIESAKNDFDATARQLREKYGVDGVAPKDLEEMIGACQAVCTGNMVWSMSTRRYDLHRDDGHRRTIIL